MASKPAAKMRVADVAAAAGVSVATVSRVLSGSHAVRDATRQLVEATVERLQYRPNQLARSLATARSRLVGLVIPDAFDATYTEIAHHLEAAVSAAGYRLILCLTGDDPLREFEAVRVLDEHRVEAVIWAPTGRNRARAQQLVAAGTPVVEIVRQSLPEAADAVLSDNDGAGYLATRHLLGLGHRRIGFVGGPPDTTTGAERAAGYRRALAEARIATDPSLMRHGSFVRGSGIELAIEVLDLPEPPTGVVAASQELAIGLLQVARARRLRIPADLSVVAHGDPIWFALVDPPLSTVTFSPKTAAEVTTRLLLKRLQRRDDDAPPAATTHRLDVRLIERGSCAPPLAAVRAGSKP